ncbi:MAG: hypothetical protein KAR44_06310 [Candidatus Aegiribacteria sp.]|nr:hypothetical protein [Candidatus Aegiribacteria sp.]
MSLIIIVALLSGVVADDFEVSPNVVYDSSTVVGIFLGYEIGDYIHPVIREDDGDVRSFWSTDPLMDYFLTCLVGSRVILEIEEADSYIPESGGMMRIFRVIGVSTNTRSFFQWRDSLEAEGDPEDLLGDYYMAPYDCLLEVSDRE